ncbi:MAG: hypothetical protein ACE5I0_10770 [Candidatus Binatia bacterium]
MTGKVRHKHWISIALAALGLLAIFLPNADAPEEVREQIVGFASIPWGATAEHIIAEHGTPTVDEAGIHRALAYGGERVLNEDTNTYFFVHPKKGLIKGAYFVDYGRGDDCVMVFMKFKEAISKRYPDIKPEEYKRNQSLLDFCGGLTIGKAWWGVFWKDPISSATISISLGLESDESILINYESPGWNEKHAKMRETERKRRF